VTATLGNLLHQIESIWISIQNEFQVACDFVKPLVGLEPASVSQQASHKEAFLLVIQSSEMGRRQNNLIRLNRSSRNYSYMPGRS
jgi:hypothetical protein